MQAPLPPQTNLTMSDIGQIESLSEDALQRHDIADSVKGMLLKYKIQQVIQQNNTSGVTTTSVDILDLQTNKHVVKENTSSVHFAASVNKIPIAWLVLQDLRAGEIQLTDAVTWLASDVRGGYGIYDQPGAPTSATVEQLLFDMLNYSGNTAVRALVNYKLDGAAAVNTRLAAYPQIPNTRLQPLDANRFYVGNSTSKESLWILQKVLAKSDKYQKVIKNALSTNIFTDYGVRAQLAGNDYIVLVNKVGILDDVDGNNRHDIGVIYNTKTHKAYGYSFMTTTPYENTTGTTQAQNSLGQMGRPTLRYAGDRSLEQGDTAVPFNAQQAPQAAPDTKVLY